MNITLFEEPASKIQLIEESEEGEISPSKIIIEKEAHFPKYTKQEKTVWAISDCYIYDNFNKYSNQIKEIKENTEFKSVGEYETGYTKIIYDDNYFYLKTEEVTTKNPFNRVAGAGKNIPYEGVIHRPDGLYFENISDKSKAIALRYWYIIPERVRKAFVEEGWSLCVTSQSIESKFGYSMSIIGITFPDTKRIYVESNEKAIRRALCHEVGHFWDCYQGWPSQTQAFKDIYYEERNKFHQVEKADGHCIGSSVEYYAEVFAQALMYPDSAYGTAPKTSHFIWG